MFCPKCKYEYTPVVTVCADCNETLVTAEELKAVVEDEKKVDASPLLEELTNGEAFADAPDFPKDIDWVHLARLNSQQVSEMLLEVLHAKNIAAVVHSETGYFGITGQLGMSSYSPIGGGYSLFVDRNSMDDVDNEASIMMGEEWEKCKLVNIA